jgi:hypothetical protein
LTDPVTLDGYLSFIENRIKLYETNRIIYLEYADNGKGLGDKEGGISRIKEIISLFGGDAYLVDDKVYPLKIVIQLDKLEE